MISNLDTQLIDAARSNRLNDVRNLVERGANPNVDDSSPLFWASRNANTQVVHYLLPLCDVAAFHNEALRIAYVNQHWNICKILLPYCNPIDPASLVSPIGLACKMGWSEIVDDYLEQYLINAEAHIVQMRNEDYTIDEIAVLENSAQSRTLRQKIGEELVLSDVTSKRKM